MADIELDSQIRDWVLIPIVLVMFIVGILRHYATKLVKGTPKVDPKQVVMSNLILRSEWLKRSNHLLPESSFLSRKTYFGDKTNGVLRSRKEGEKDPLQDTAAMMDMMKGNTTMIVFQMVMMGVVSTFFSGFIIVKLPFMLGDRFKVMLQRGVNLNSLDVTYVSSMSWYFVNVFGLRGLFSLVLGDDNETDDAKMMQSQMGQSPMGPGQDPAKLLNGQADALDMIVHQNVLDSAERDLLACELTPQERDALRTVKAVSKKTQ